MNKLSISNWQFTDPEGSFRIDNPHRSNYLYFPLVNEAGMKSAITPNLSGDVKIDQNVFLTPPQSVEDLHTSRAARNFWVYNPDVGAWSVTGNSALQITHQFSESNTEEVTLEAGFLWHKLIRSSQEVGLCAETINFVPSNADNVELMKVTLSNISQSEISVTPTAAIPIYGRSADNIRDHRHVSSLLHRIRCSEYGVFIKPSLSFDERGHLPNTVTYAVLGTEDDGTKPIGFIPVLEDFIGEGGTLDWPETIVKSLPPTAQADYMYEGFESIGAIRFADTIIKPGESKSFIIILTIIEQNQNSEFLLEKYGSEAAFDNWLAKTKEFWKTHLSTFAVETSEERFDLWLRWVAIQPTLRRLFGNSFLPYHDYGRGGRGWRDLWQDILAMLLMENDDVSEFLYSNFAGVRLDGSNATIIGNAPGEFKADRNNIPRVWMDHGTWPLMTTHLYIDQTGDLAFLLRKQSYFKDHLVFRSQKVDEKWDSTSGTIQKTNGDSDYKGTILEHILIQHLIQFFNVGEHNNIRLEGADWNDGMDMAPNRGESVAFSAFYASNLRQLVSLISQLEEIGEGQVEIAAEMQQLLDTLSEPIDYGNPEEKHKLLENYFIRVKHKISGEKIWLPIEKLIKDLERKANWMTNQIRNNEWIQNNDGFQWFNSYYDDDGQRVEGDFGNGVRMILTGQVFTLMGEIATDEQAKEIVRAVDQYLYDPSVGGYRLNTNFGEVIHTLGRAFGFAYGHKENGSMFSHMAVMYAYALYKRGFIFEGYKLLNDIYQHSQNFMISRMYPGIPEYINSRGRGVYPYLTGSASWYLLTFVTEVYGMRGEKGDLSLKPKLVADQFDQNGNASLKSMFAHKVIQLRYHNPQHLEYGFYQIDSILLNEKPVSFSGIENGVIIPRELIEEQDSLKIQLDVYLKKE